MQSETQIDYIAEAIEETFGERCPDYSDGCPTCEAWKRFDYLESLAALSTDAEPVAWQPRYKQEVIDHHKSIGSDLWEYAMTVYPTKEQAQGYGYGGHECRALYAAPPAPSVAVKDWSAEIKKLREYRRLAYNTGFLYLADWMEEMAAALSAQVQDVAGDEEWQTVPKHPTGKMIDAVVSMVDGDAPHPFILNLYRAMLAVAPAKQEGGE